jgi:hypothetical protein
LFAAGFGLAPFAAAAVPGRWALLPAAAATAGLARTPDWLRPAAAAGFAGAGLGLLATIFAAAGLVFFPAAALAGAVFAGGLALLAAGFGLAFAFAAAPRRWALEKAAAATAGLARTPAWLRPTVAAGFAGTGLGFFAAAFTAAGLVLVPAFFAAVGIMKRWFPAPVCELRLIFWCTLRDEYNWELLCFATGWFPGFGLLYCKRLLFRGHCETAKPS